MPKVVRSQPVSCNIGSWKNPIEERGPKASNEIRQAQEIAKYPVIYREPYREQGNL